MTSLTEENYLKAIHHLLNENKGKEVSTNQIAELMVTKAASVTDMLKKLSEKKLVNYQKYKGVKLSPKGNSIALEIIRKHRLWEVFLVDKLNFKWDQIHVIAEQLEHIQSNDLTNKLEEFLGFPKFDPHGDPIPNSKGVMPIVNSVKLTEAPIQIKLTVLGVSEDSQDFLQHLDQLKIKIGSQLTITSKSKFDQSINTILGQNKELTLTKEVAKNLLVSFKVS